MESGSDIQSIEYQNEYIVSIKSPNDHIIIIIFLSFLRDHERDHENEE